MPPRETGRLNAPNTARPQLPNVPIPIPTPTGRQRDLPHRSGRFRDRSLRAGDDPVDHRKDGTLLVGTEEGLVYRVSPAQEETNVLAKVNPKQVMSMPRTTCMISLGLKHRKGWPPRPVVGRMDLYESGFGCGADQPVWKDLAPAQALRVPRSLWPFSQRKSSEPGGCDASKWSEEVAATGVLPVSSPSARFVQYRLSFTTRRKSTAVVDEVIGWSASQRVPQ